MNINLSCYSKYVVSFFKQSVLPAFTDQQKRILTIVSIAFAFIAFCYIAKEYWNIKTIIKFDEFPKFDESPNDELNEKVKKGVSKKSLENGPLVADNRISDLNRDMGKDEPKKSEELNNQDEECDSIKIPLETKFQFQFSGGANSTGEGKSV